MEVQWIATMGSQDIALSNGSYNQLLRPKKVTLNFGMLKISLNPVIYQELAEDSIGLPRNLLPGYTIPIDIPYECYLRDRELHLGPVIAYVERGKFKDVANQIFFSILPKFLEYNTIKGLIFICTADSINVEKNLIKGYYFDPQGQSPLKVWKYGSFPLPKVMFNRSPHLSRKKISMLKKKIGNNIFNTYFHNLNKWKLWQTLSQDTSVIKHLPYTEKYRDGKQIEVLLQKYAALYLKPFKKSRGRGIMLVTKEKGKVILVNNRKEKWFFSNYSDLTNFLLEKINLPYIVQQAVPFKINRQRVDFRLVLQKDESKMWVYAGLMARIVSEEDIITNMFANPETILGRVALIEIYKLKEEEAALIERKMTKLVIQAIKSYEAKGMHLGDVAADIVLDANLHIWLLELQLNQGIYGKTGALPPEFFNVILTNPFKYAKAISNLAD